MMASPAESACILFCISECIARRQQQGKPIPEWMALLHGKLSATVELDELMSGSDTFASASGQGFRSNAAQFEEKLITATDAAKILKVDVRSIRRIAADLDGEVVGNRWLFRETTVREYAA